MNELPDKPEAAELSPGLPSWGRLTPAARDAIAVVLIVLASMVLTRLGTEYAESLPLRGKGWQAEHTGSHALFRFDAVHYLSIARDGYAFDGDLGASPNIVFFPLYPLLVRVFRAVTGLGWIEAGFWVTRVCLLLGCLAIFAAMRNYFGRAAGYFAVCGLLFSPGSFALHAYYSESTMLLCLGLAFLLLQQRRYWLQALAAGALSASRVTAGPICGLFALNYVRLAWLAWRQEGEQRRRLAEVAKYLACSVLTCSGFFAYIGYFWTQWGNPFRLLPAIQAASWGKFHHPVSLWELVTFRHLFVHGWSWMTSEAPFLTDIKTTNWWCLALGLTAAAYGLWRWKPWIFRLGFAGYVLLIYQTNAGSEWLNSVHRYMVPMLPIYLMLHDGWRWLRVRHRWAGRVAAAGLLGGGAAYMVIYLVYFCAGVWYYF